MRAKVNCLLILVLMLSGASAFAQTTCLPDSCGVSSSAIEENRWPNVRPLEIDNELIGDRDYRRIEGEFSVHTAPNSDDSEPFGDGYTFVTVVEQHGDWTKIGDNQWVRSDILSDSVRPSRFAGVMLPTLDALPYTVAWTLTHFRAASAPGGPESAENPFRYRYSRVYIYATVAVDGYNWYQIGPHEWVHQFKVAKILPVSRPEAVDTHKWVSVDLYEQVAIAYEGDEPVFATLVSSGYGRMADQRRRLPCLRSLPAQNDERLYNKPDFYYLQEVPWTMFYDDQIALHGAYWHDGFGYRRSHGCVNMTITDAHWLFNWSQSEYDWHAGDHTGPAVYVYSSGEYE